MTNLKCETLKIEGKAGLENRLEDYLDLQSFLAKYPQFKESQLRWMVVRRKDYGLESSIKRIGRRLYFHVPSFLKWVEKQNI